MLTTRPATPADVRAFYPDSGTSVRAWVAEVDGEVQGIIGLALLRPVACAFSQFREPLKPYLNHPAIWRLVKKLQAVMQQSRLPVRAIVETGVTDRRALERVGFRYLGKIDGDGVFQYRGQD